MQADIIVPIVAILTIFVFAPLLFFVAPIWLFLHYRDARVKANLLSSDDNNKLDKMLQLAENMQDRIATLEAILDKEHPDWRKLS